MRLFRALISSERLENRRLLSSVTSFSLINADTDQPIAGYVSLDSGDVLDLAKLPTRHLNVQVKLDSTPGSVKYAYDGNSAYRIEGSAPFSIAGDTNGDFNAWTPSLGSHTLKATPYSGAGATGTAGGSMSVNFSVVDSGSSSPTPTPTPSPTPTPTPTGSFAHVYTAGPGGAYKTIAAAAAVAGPGDEVLVLPGTYYESLSLTRSGVAGKPITFAAQTPGSVTLDGAGKKSVLKSGGATYITIDGINVNHASNAASTDAAAVSTSTGWTLRNMIVQNTDGVGVEVYGSNVYLLNVTAQYNGRQGISGDGCSYVTLKSCTTRGNNTKGNDPDYDAGAGKWFQTDHVTIDGLSSFDNAGPGIWFDYHNTNVVIKNSKSYNNHGVAHAWSGNGLRTELNTGSFLVQNNQFWGNTGAQVDIDSCKHVTLSGNAITGTNVTLKDWPRGSEFALSNITITGNTFVASGILTEGGTWTSTSGSAKSLTIDYNTYKSGLTYSWNYVSTCHTLADVRNKLGFEKNGTTA